jgi:hypothetical protein
MLSVKRSMLLLMLCLTTAAVHAQPKAAPVAAFTSLSSTITVSETTIAGAMQMSKGQEVTVPLSPEFNFPGTVLSNENVYENLQTIIIKSSIYNHSLLQLSKQINDDKSITYVGRIFNPGGADGYGLKRGVDGTYHLEKFETAIILQDCHQQ